MIRGIKTTEFWITLATNVVAMVALFGGIEIEDAPAVTEAAVQVVVALAAIAQNIVYIVGRVQVKASAK